jgi:hypothetical protein
MTFNEAFDKWWETADSVSPTITMDMGNARLAFDAGWNARDEEVRDLQKIIDGKNQKIQELLKMLHDFLARVDCPERR